MIGAEMKPERISELRELCKAMPITPYIISKYMEALPEALNEIGHLRKALSTAYKFITTPEIGNIDAACAVLLSALNNENYAEFMKEFERFMEGTKE